MDKEFLEKQESQRRANNLAGLFLVVLFFPWLAVYLLWLLPIVNSFLGHIEIHIHLGLIFLPWAGLGLLVSHFFPAPQGHTEPQSESESSIGRLL